MRQYFGNALHWYQVLVAMATHQVDTWILHTTLTKPMTAPTMNAEEGTLPQGCPYSPFEHPPFEMVSHGLSRDSEMQSPPDPADAQFYADAADTPFPPLKDFHHIKENPLHDSMPSVCLQRQCPLCFSGGKPKFCSSQYVLMPLSVHIPADTPYQSTCYCMP